MSRPHIAAILLTFFVLLGLFVIGATAVPDVRLTVSDVEMSPEEPTAEEAVTITPTIESSIGSTGAVEIEPETSTAGAPVTVPVTL